MLPITATLQPYSDDQFEDAGDRAVTRAVKDVRKAGYKKIDVDSKTERRIQHGRGSFEFDILSGPCLKFDSGYTERKMNAKVEGKGRRGKSKYDSDTSDDDYPVVKHGDKKGARRVDMKMEERSPQQTVEISIPTLLGLKPMAKNHHGHKRGEITYRK